MIPPFLSALLRSPRQIGAVAPSGTRLADAMAAQVDQGSANVLELGPGTGSITSALLRTAPIERRLILLEKDAGLARILERQFPEVQIMTGDAAHLHRIMPSAGIQQFDAVVSSLPLLGMSRFARTRVAMRIFASLRPGGKLIQYTYSTASPISRRLAAVMDVEIARVAVVLRNLPPASVWVYTAKNGTAAETGFGAWEPTEGVGPRVLR
jgi:phosphatidylethanolamine/phosphatidyl-N-methylethanolamine N-methyltransferase